MDENSKVLIKTFSQKSRKTESEKNKFLVEALSLDNPNPNVNFKAQLVAALMIQSNALISIKTAELLCSISRQEIDRRVHSGSFPKPEKLSSEDKATRKAFRLNDIQSWLKSPTTYDWTQTIE